MNYRCPRCKNENIIDFEELIHCPSCELDFYKKSLDVFGEEGILAIQELKAFHDVLNEDEKKKLENTTESVK